ncbi:TPA: hypothetical protein QCX85_005238 [Bacillus toyonensis]|uniref:hypothetical protein n=1 Tax=Bacillus toyonensis TaxID=155322 RepID=UPI0016767315|nr:hypothetical protein [Bacillus toyonensis]HDR7689688.1 hypothetical protein [Bacillus toyonensis]
MTAQEFKEQIYNKLEKVAQKRTNSCRAPITLTGDYVWNLKQKILRPLRDKNPIKKR